MVLGGSRITLTTTTSREGRGNLTDFQETAQWLGGTDVPLAIFQRLIGDCNQLEQRTVIVHGYLYDGPVEAASLDLSLASFSTSDDNKAFQILGQ